LILWRFKRQPKREQQAQRTVAYMRMLGDYDFCFSSRKTHLQAPHGVKSAYIFCPEFRAEASL
jgi:hypothetical protein